MVRIGLKKYKCELCGYTDTVELHHINGNPTDNRLVNLQMLCPNCHAKTENYRSKNTPSRVHNAPETYFMTDAEVKQRYEEKLAKRRVPEDQKKRKSKPLFICPICGKEFKAKGTQKFCSVECYKQSVKTNRPTLLELIESFKQLNSFVQVGRKYNVSDKAIVK